MSLFGNLVQAFVEGALEQVSQQQQRQQASDSSGSVDQNRSMRFVGDVTGATGVVDVRVRRIQNHRQDVFRIEGTLRTPCEFYRFEVDGHSGYGKFHDETVIRLQIDERNLAITVNPFRPPAPTYHFRRA